MSKELDNLVLNRLLEHIARDCQTSIEELRKEAYKSDLIDFILMNSTKERKNDKH